jgi:hypothetical protein
MMWRSILRIRKTSKRLHVRGKWSHDSGVFMRVSRTWRASSRDLDLEREHIEALAVVLRGRQAVRLSLHRRWQRLVRAVHQPEVVGVKQHTFGQELHNNTRHATRVIPQLAHAQPPLGEKATQRQRHTSLRLRACSANSRWRSFSTICLRSASSSALRAFSASSAARSASYCARRS